MRYLLITHIPFALRPDGSILLDRLWSDDLAGMVAANGPIRVAAPRIEPAALQSWGPDCASLSPGGPVSFLALPTRRHRLDLTHPFRVKRLLHAAVDQADLVHTSNLFDPWTCLYAAHDYAVQTGKKTLFVVAEDFYDMSEWESVRTAGSALGRWRRRRTLHRLDRHVQRRVATASLAFLHTPAAVARYRSYAANAVAIRQPVHESEDVIDLAALTTRLDSLATTRPLRIVTASRFKPLKGLDFLIRAIAILEQRGIPIDARLYGEGPQQAAYQALAARLGVAHRVAFPGPLAPRSVLQERLSKADLFVMPHLTSDFGRGFFDAIACGLPVVAFRSLASQDTVRDHIDGLLVSNADAEALAAGIARFHADRTLLATASHEARNRALVNTKSFWSDYRAQMIRDLFAADNL